MKNIIKITAMILAIASILPLLVSCNNGDGYNSPSDTSLDMTEDTSSVTSEAETTIPPESLNTKLMENGKLKYTVIKYPADPDETTFEAVKRLRDKIKEYTGTMPTIKPDYSSSANPANPETYEILVGETNYEESKKVLADINYGDYIITTSGNKILIAAYSSNEISRAINYIINTMLKEKDEQGNYKLEIADYKYMETRLMDSVNINGNDLKEYSIVYGTVGVDDNYNIANAKLLRSIFSEKAGYVLPLIKDTDECATKRKIYVGSRFAGLPDTSKVDPINLLSYSFKTINNDFFIMGGGLLSNQLAVAEFISTYFHMRPADGKVNITDSDGTFLKVKEAPKAEGTTFRVMTYNITAQWEGWGGDYMPIEQRYEGFKAVIDIYDPDIVGLQEVSSQWSDKIEYELKQYAFVNKKTPDGSFVNLSPIMYKRDRFTVIDSGLEYFKPQGANHIRHVNWAILKDKKTGELMAFFNTHWDPSYIDHHLNHIATFKSVMEAHPDVKYAFSTGDYNANPNNEQYSFFMSKTGLVNSRDVARTAGTLKNDHGGCAPIGVDKEVNGTSGPIDHIFISKNISVLAYETVIWNCVHHVSDHSPKYADIVFGN